MFFRNAVCVSVVLAACGYAPVIVSAQWPSFPSVGIPRHPDGGPDYYAKTPRTADGKPDISGLWLPATPYVLNPNGRPPGDVPFQPWAEALVKERAENSWRDDPSAACIAGGVPRVDLIPYPFRIVNAPGRMIILYEIYHEFREIFTDGRPLPTDVVPTWMGYSIGAWEGDAFVVRSSGFNGRAWIDTDGRPTTDAMNVIERFVRKDVGHMELEVTIDDPKAYTRPWTILVPLSLLPDTELIEYVCAENNRYFELLPK